MRSLRDSLLIYEADDPALSGGLFLSAGQRLVFHCRTAVSSLHGTFRPPLAGGAQSLEQPPYARLAISLTSECFDQLANPSQGPQIAAVSLRQRACLQ